MIIMTKVKLPKNEHDLTPNVRHLVADFIRTINAFIIAEDINDDEIVLAAAWVARLYEE